MELYVCSLLYLLMTSGTAIAVISFTCQYDFTKCYNFIFILILYFSHTDTRAKPVSAKKSYALSDFEERCTDKCFEMLSSVCQFGSRNEDCGYNL